jgi:hypothetical protein
MWEVIAWVSAAAIAYAVLRALQIQGSIKSGRRLFFVASGAPSELVAAIVDCLSLSSGEFQVARLDAEQNRLVLRDLRSPLYWYPVWLYDLGDGHALVRVAVTGVWPVLRSENHRRCQSLLKSILLHKGVVAPLPEILMFPRGGSRRSEGLDRKVPAIGRNA